MQTIGWLEYFSRTCMQIWHVSIYPTIFFIWFLSSLYLTASDRIPFEVPKCFYNFLNCSKIPMDLCKFSWASICGWYSYKNLRCFLKLEYIWISKKRRKSCYFSLVAHFDFFNRNISVKVLMFSPIWYMVATKTAQQWSTKMIILLTAADVLVPRLAVDAAA